MLSVSFRSPTPKPLAVGGLTNGSVVLWPRFILRGYEQLQIDKWDPQGESKKAQNPPVHFFLRKWSLCYVFAVLTLEVKREALPCLELLRCGRSDLDRAKKSWLLKNRTGGRRRREEWMLTPVACIDLERLWCTVAEIDATLRTLQVNQALGSFQQSISWCCWS